MGTAGAGVSSAVNKLSPAANVGGRRRSHLVGQGNNCTMSIASVDLSRPGSPAALPALLLFAWLLEAVGVACGIVNAAYTTFQNDFPSTLVGWLPALPLVVLASTELLRIPPAQAFQRKRRLVPRVLALAALVPICGIALENWTFGIERIVNLRLAQGETRREALRRAEDGLKAARDGQQRDAE